MAFIDSKMICKGIICSLSHVGIPKLSLRGIMNRILHLDTYNQQPKAKCSQGQWLSDDTTDHKNDAIIDLCVMASSTTGKDNGSNVFLNFAGFLPG